MWYQFLFMGFSVCAKIYDIGSVYGINGGRISKLEARRAGRIVANYDRGWGIKPVDDDAQNAIDALVALYQ